MKEILLAELVRETDKAVCLRCRCRWLMPDAAPDKICWDDIEIWFPKGKEYADGKGHVKLDDDKWFARDWILEAKEEEQAKNIPGVARFEIQLVEGMTVAEIAASSETEPRPAQREDPYRPTPDVVPVKTLEDPVEDDDLPF